MMRSYKRGYAIEVMVCMGFALCLFLAMSEGCAAVKKTAKTTKKITVTFPGDESNGGYRKSGESP